MKVGFTGTRQGMTPEQHARVWDILVDVMPVEVHHGDCIGADAEFDEEANRLAIPVVIHPPNITRYRAFCTGAKLVWEPKDYLARNKVIVMCSDILLATPKEDYEVRRSGTWATIRYAEARPIPTTIILPNGTLIERNR